MHTAMNQNRTHHRPAADPSQLDPGDIAQRLRRLIDLEKLVQEQSEELAWTNERLVTELYDRSAMEATATQQARHDPVTGLANRLSLEERMANALNAHRASSESAAVVFVGLERLAEVRDTLGYQAGDYVVRQIAERLRNAVRGSDLIARIGDDEFAVLLMALRRAEDAAIVARKLYSALDVPLVVGGHQIRLEPAVGVSVYPQDGETSDLLLARADGAMRFAREHRTGLTQFFRPEIAQRSARRLSIEADLRAALERNQFCVHYQPRYEVKSRKLIGAEALVRWQHPERGLIAPGEFLDVAEDTGLIVPIGEAVLAQACAAAATWSKAGKPLSVAVNLSPREFRGKSMLDQVEQALHASGLAPQRLQLELNETALVRPLDEVDAAALEGLHKLGVRVTLDCFGAGAASLALLRKLPVDAIKIDGQFVRHAPEDARDAAIVEVIALLARKLRLTVVAGGVESEAQWDLMKRLGFDEAQGFLLGRPMPVNEFEALCSRAGASASSRRSRKRAVATLLT
jgi:diguanylate cyclase (GGDEF)-like protein